MKKQGGFANPGLKLKIIYDGPHELGTCFFFRQEAFTGFFFLKPSMGEMIILSLGMVALTLLITFKEDLLHSDAASELLHKHCVHVVHDLGFSV